MKKQLIVISFKPNQLNTLEVYDEEDFDEAHARFSELMENKDPDDEVWTTTREAFFEKYIQPVSYKEWLQFANEFLNSNMNATIEHGDYFDEYKSGVKWEVIVVKSITENS